MRNLKYAWLLVVLLVLAACGQQEMPEAAQVRNAAAPSITSDKEDYAPGELVTLTGSNWQPGESVHINVDDDQTKTWKRDVDVTADENGNITDQFNLPNWFVATYQVTATGEQSGVATASFTDANVQAKANLPDKATTKVRWVLYNTNNCTGTEVAKSAAEAVTLTGSTASGLTGASKEQSLKLTAAASSSDNKAFAKWTDSNGNTLAKFGNDATTICQTGFNNGEGIVTFTANYAAVPSVTTTTVGSITASESTFGGKTNLSAKVTPAGAPGSVAFFVNGSTTAAVGTVSYDSSTGVATLSGYEHKLEARDTAYSVKTVFISSSASYSNSESPNNTALTVGKAATSTALQSSLNPSTEGQSVTFTATISVTPPGGGTASGNVQFKVDGSNAGNPVVLNSAQATFTTSSLAVGNRSVTAEYLGSGNYSGSTSATLSQTVNAACVAPSIETQPAGVTTTVGGAATFSVTAGGTGTLSYQWRKGDNNIQGATSASYDLTSVTTTDAGNYSVKVTNSCGTVTSNVATLTVNKASATISLSNLSHTYDGSAKSATVTTSPKNLDGLSISYSQNGKAVSEPTNAGSYTVVAKLDNPSYSAEDATDTLVIGKADQTITGVGRGRTDTRSLAYAANLSKP